MPLPITTQDCHARMFVASLCLTDDDIRALGLQPTSPTCCVSAQTQARSLLHALLREDELLAQEVTDRLDLRHCSDVARVRASSVEEIHRESQIRGRSTFGEPLVGWAWALLTDPRAEAQQLARNLMGECYVRGMQGLAQEPSRSLA
ncbi:MAG: hypothetical protein AAF726_04420 [Planctomycetota bacterium]